MQMRRFWQQRQVTVTGRVAKQSLLGGNARMLLAHVPMSETVKCRLIIHHALSELPSMAKHSCLPVVILYKSTLNRNRN